MKIPYNITFSFLLTTSLCAYDNNTLQRTIKHHAHKHVPVTIHGPNNKNIGYGNCDFLHNGEEVVVSSFIKKNDIIIDAGAHIGGWTESVIKATHGFCYIYAFEPVPHSYQKLEQLKNKYRNKVFTFNTALGSQDTELEMNYFFQRGSDCSTLFNRPVLSDVPVKKIKVLVTSLDKFTQEYAIEHINFLKIDTEGAEWEVLIGSRQLIEENKIDIIQFEYGGTYPDANITLAQVYDYLTSHNYMIFRIVPNGLIYIPVWDNALENATYSNYLALKQIS